MPPTASEFIELAKLQLDRYKNTRDHRFKVSLTLWTFILGTGAFCYSNKIQWEWWFIIPWLLLFILNIFWMLRMQISMREDNNRFIEYRDNALKGVNNVKNMVQNKNLCQKIKDCVKKPGWVYFELFVSIVLFIFIYILLRLTPLPDNMEPEKTNTVNQIILNK